MQARRPAAGGWRVEAAASLAAAALLAGGWAAGVARAPGVVAVGLLASATVAGLAPALARAATALRGGTVGRDLLVVCAAALAALGGDLTGAAAVAVLFAGSEASAAYAEDRVLRALGRGPLDDLGGSAPGRGRDGGCAALARVAPGALAVAALLAVGAPAVLGEPREIWLQRAAVVLIAAALLPIAARAVMVVALAAAGARGALVRDAPMLRRLSRARALVLDESGGPLLRRAEVSEVLSGPMALDAQVSLSAALGVAATLSRRADPAVADAIHRHVARMGIPPVEVEHVHSLPGGGAAARVHGATVFVGTPELFRDRLGVPLDGLGRDAVRLHAEGKRLVVLGDLRGAWLGIAVAERPVPGALEAVRRAGVRQTAILARDADEAQPEAQQAGAQVHLARTPEERRRCLAGLGKRVAVVTRARERDAAALPRDGVSVHVGPRAAEFHGDVALASDDLSLLPWLFEVSRRAHALLAQNVVVATALLAGLGAAAITGEVGVGVAALWTAIGRVVLAVNAVRAAG